MTARNMLKDWGPVLLWAAVIFYFSSLPATVVPYPFPQADKLFHLSEYFLFAILLSRALRERSSWGKVAFLGCVVALGAVYGLSDEFHQTFVPGRDCSLIDLFFDIIGATAGGSVYVLSWRK